eukprot:TRINITY_DN136590_c0_g1_i1.p1 TRINITY_DN136590_c0_g1~~TRINITY_DN136590_c0_g1_i1.p1  ORF type:complete len:112 (-),score=27.82 TRINITY_DN136590_c0_g1_i1:28-363(-)
MATTPAVTATPTTPTSVAVEETLGYRATKIAGQKASQWLDDTWSVITRLVMDTAQRGLFHCTVRFEDVIPQDPENQARLIKILQRQNLKGSFKTREDGGVQLEISWGSEFL